VLEMLEAFPVIAMAAAIVFLPLLSEKPPRPFSTASDENSRRLGRSAELWQERHGTKITDCCQMLPDTAPHLAVLKPPVCT
jgi:hypothetical protein